MPGKILIVESLPTTRIVLKVKLSSAFYTVSQAAALPEALLRLEEDRPDLILLGADWSEDGKGLALCRALRKAQSGAPVPILMMSTHATPEMRKAALRAGADDLVAKPADEAELMARIRALIRTRDSVEGLHLREEATAALGFAEAETIPFRPDARIVLAAADPATGVRWNALLKPVLPYSVATEPIANLLRALSQQTPPDALVIAPSPDAPEDGLRLLAELRARAATRRAAVLVVLPPACRDLFTDALDLGAGDVMADGFDAEEVALRLERLVERKRLADRLQKRVQDGLEAAVTDPLTGLFNRRYALPHLARVAEISQRDQRDFAVMVADLDHFKTVNDRYGHAAGDTVLSEVAHRLRDCLRPGDLLARIGGEEFLVVMPATDRATARAMATRLCDTLRRDPIHIQSRDLRIPVTVSIGLAMSCDFRCAVSGEDRGDAMVRTLLDRADQALYGAKATGRDQVTLSPPAA
ncbi:diguanylate cyclase [Shimia aestuarii]|uniref:diguanylate cyclase n=1 Tax=Shimia aestuarii TaxID=254406 RepID=UPI001FB209A2|nr:diguanylate cyclase [Shimia aestuarii]